MDVCRLEDFKEAFIKLDEAIDSEIHSGNSDFSDDIKDLNDFLGILWKLNIQYDTVDELKEKLQLFDINIDDYPHVKKYVDNDLNDDGIIWSDGHV